MCWWGEVLQRFEGCLDNDTVEVAGLHERLAVCTALGTARVARWGPTAEGRWGMRQLITVRPTIKRTPTRSCTASG